MSRTTPDPVFTAAVREEVARRVRASSGASASPGRRRPWVMELGAIAGVGVLVGGIAVGAIALRPVLDAGGAPAGSVTRSAPATDEPTTAPTQETPTAAPPTSVAPTTPPPSEVPTLPAAPLPTTDPTTTPPTASVALIGPTGAIRRSSAEIRTWALSLGFGSIWAEQAVLDASCMADRGYRYDPEFARSGGAAAQHAGLTATQYADFQDALWGPQTGLPYTWQTAGCHGRSVHLTGQDNNH